MINICAKLECGKPVKYLGMCDTHARAVRRAMNTEVCSEDGCERLTASRGLCHTHYMRVRRALNPEKALLQKKRDRERAKVFAAKKRTELLASGEMSLREADWMAKFTFELANSDELKELFWQFVKKELSL